MLMDAHRSGWWTSPGGKERKTCNNPGSVVNFLRHGSALIAQGRRRRTDAACFLMRVLAARTKDLQHAWQRCEFFAPRVGTDCTGSSTSDRRSMLPDARLSGKNERLATRLAAL